MKLWPDLAKDHSVFKIIQQGGVQWDCGKIFWSGQDKQQIQGFLGSV